MINKCKCMNCKSRYIGCHSECESYLSFRKERDEILELRRKIKRARYFRGI